MDNLSLKTYKSMSGSFHCSNLLIPTKYRSSNYFLFNGNNKTFDK